jgi:hypothetical protein
LEISTPLGTVARLQSMSGCKYQALSFPFKHHTRPTALNQLQVGDLAPRDSSVWFSSLCPSLLADHSQSLGVPKKSLRKLAYSSRISKSKMVPSPSSSYVKESFQPCGKVRYRGEYVLTISVHLENLKGKNSLKADSL